MMRQQFNHPVYCAICNEFIWYSTALHGNTFEFSFVALSGVFITKAINARNVPSSPIGSVINAFHFRARSLLQYVQLAMLRPSIHLF